MQKSGDDTTVQCHPAWCCSEQVARTRRHRSRHAQSPVEPGPDRCVWHRVCAFTAATCPWGAVIHIKAEAHAFKLLCGSPDSISIPSLHVGHVESLLETLRAALSHSVLERKR